jgi:integrase
MGMQTGDVQALAIGQKNFQNFLKRLERGSQNTKDLYEWGVRLLATFLQKPHPDETVRAIKSFDVYEMIDAFTGWLVEQKYSSNSIINAVTGVRSWCWYNDIEIYNEKMRKKVQLPTREEAVDDAPTRDQIRQILTHMRFELQNKILILTCSGIRPVDIKFLKWSDFKWDEKPVRLLVPGKGKTKRGWETFITEELAERLRMQKNFMKTEKIYEGGLTTATISSLFSRARKKVPGR